MKTIFLSVFFLLFFFSSSVLAEVYQLKTKEADGIGHGNAVAISKTELLTNWHLVNNKLEILILVGTDWKTAEVLKSDKAYDIALIKINEEILIPCEFAKSKDMPVKMIGFRYSQIPILVNGSQYFETNSELEKNDVKYLSRSQVIVENRFQVGFSGSGVFTENNTLYALISSGFRINEENKENIFLQKEANIVPLIHILDFLGKI